MNVRSMLCFCSVVALATSLTADPQSLPELAKQEKARRARIRATSGPAKVYTEGNRTGTATDPNSESLEAPGAEAAPPAPNGKKEKTPEELAAEKQAEWNDRLQKAQDEIKSVEEAIASNERALASMFNITPARADLVNRIEADKKKVESLKQTLVSLEDERRRAGMPRVR